MRLVGLYLVIELAALVAVVWWLGLGWTLLLLLVSAAVGMWLLRRQGSRAALAVTQAVHAGRVPHAELTDGALVGLGGLLILLPGVVSDLLGLLLMLPLVRQLARRWLLRAAERRSPALRTVRIRDGGPVIDGEVVPGPTAERPARWPEQPKVIEGRVID